jgi:hemerythrin-like domain-containing protein
MKRSRALTPLSSEHHRALLVAFQLKKSLAGHAESAGAPRDLPGLLSLARGFASKVLEPHLRAEEELLSPHLSGADGQRLASEHAELRRLIGQAAGAPAAGQRILLSGFAELLERHVRWEERELFASLEAQAGEAALEAIGAELERRLALAGQGQRGERS